jgi:predicted PurR-regulated permease PerM
MYLLHWAQEAFIPIVLSILISYSLEPIVHADHAGAVPRIIAAGLVVLMTGGVLGYGIYSLSDDADGAVAQVPEAAQRLRRMMDRDRSPGPIEQVQKAAAELQKTADQATGTNPARKDVTRVQIEEPAINVRQYVTWGSTSLVTFAGQATLVFFFVFFLLASGDLFKRKLVKLAGPSLEKKKITVQILDEINRQIARFLFVAYCHERCRRRGHVDRVLDDRRSSRRASGERLAGIFNTVPYFGPGDRGDRPPPSSRSFSLEPSQWRSTCPGISLVITSIEGWLLTPG